VKILRIFIYTYQKVVRKLSDLRIILSYEFKMKGRALKSTIKNLYIGMIVMGTLLGVAVFQFGRMILLNLEVIIRYSNLIILGISVILLIFTLIYKRIPLEWHPASMIYLSGPKFRNILKLSLLKKTIPYALLSMLLAFILNNFKMSFQTIQVFLSLWNLFIISVVTRYFIYNKGLNIKIVGFLLIYTTVMNIQLYINKYLSIILILYLTYVSILCIRDALNIDFDFNISFTDMVFINKAKYLARKNTTADAQEFAR